MTSHKKTAPESVGALYTGPGRHPLDKKEHAVMATIPNTTDGRRS